MPDVDDKSLFKAEMQGVKPLGARHNLRAKPGKAPPKALKIKTPEPELPQISDHLKLDDEACLKFQRPGVQHKVLRRLKRGDMPCENSLDLHGSSIDVAREQLLKFIHQAQQANLRVVLIIHGKGNRSQGKIAVLKIQTNIWLRQLKAVLAFCPAQQRDGGSGAVYVLLKRLSNE